jgi:Secretion system C-terminal sorting domain
MKKLIFTLSLMVVSNWVLATVNIISTTQVGSNIEIVVEANTSFGQGVMAQLRYGGTPDFTNFVSGAYVMQSNGLSQFKVIIPVGVGTFKIPANATNISVQAAKCDFGTINNGFEYTLFLAASPLSTVLLVEVSNFNALKNGQNINLSWLTASEKANENFSIERSKDGRNFVAIGQLKGAFNSTVSKDYNYTDASPLKGINYYRLKSKEVGGKATYSNVVSVSLLDKNNKTFVYPNPVTQSALQLEHEALTEGDLNIRIMDLTGRIVLMEKRAVANGSNVISLNVNNLSNGQYLIAVDEQLIRFVKN